MVMKRISLFLALNTFLLLSTTLMYAQSEPETKGKIIVISTEDEEDGPIMFKFEPDYLLTTENRKEKIAQTKRILDTLDITENKRRRLLKDLYKNGLTKRLSKVLVVENKYEENEQ